MRTFVINERNNGEKARIALSQGDYGFALELRVESIRRYLENDSGWYLTLRGKRPDGDIFEESVTVSDYFETGIVRVFLIPEMTEARGDTQCELIFHARESNEHFCIAKFILSIEKTPGYIDEAYKLPFVRLVERTISGAIMDETITTIGYYAFEECVKLKSAEFQNCQTVSDSAFLNCTELRAMTFPVCSYIGYSAFAGCRKLSVLTLLSESVVSLKYSPVRIFTVSSSMSIFVPESLVSSYKTDTNWRTVSSWIFPYVG